MPSRAAKVEKRQRQSQRDKASHAAGLAADETLRLVRAERAARKALVDRWGLGEIVPVRGGLQQAVIQIAGSARRIGPTPWFSPGLAGREPLDVALRDTPSDWDPAEPQTENYVHPGDWGHRATVVGVNSAVVTLAEWLSWSGDRELLLGVLALGGFPAAARLVSE